MQLRITLTTQKPTTTKIKVAKVSPKAKNVKGKKIKLSWKKIKGVKGYQVRYALSKGKLKKAKIKACKKNSYVIKKLKNKKYFVQVSWKEKILWSMEQS